jgi:hypothetical protein
MTHKPKKRRWIIRKKSRRKGWRARLVFGEDVGQGPEDDAKASQ